MQRYFGGGYCGDSGIRMSFQVGFYLRNELQISRSLPVTMSSWRFKFCVSRSDCLHA